MRNKSQSHQYKRGNSSLDVDDYYTKKNICLKKTTLWSIEIVVVPSKYTREIKQLIAIQNQIFKNTSKNNLLE